MNASNSFLERSGTISKLQFVSRSVACTFRAPAFETSDTTSRDRTARLSVPVAVGEAQGLVYCDTVFDPRQRPKLAYSFGFFRSPSMAGPGRPQKLPQARQTDRQTWEGEPSFQSMLSARHGSWITMASRARVAAGPFLRYERLAFRCSFALVTSKRRRRRRETCDCERGATSRRATCVQGSSPVSIRRSLQTCRSSACKLRGVVLN
jgi:hypothetical protein